MRRSCLPLLLCLLAFPLRAATPYLVKDIDPVPSSDGSAPRDFVAAGGLAYFTASDGATGAELWRTNGTLGGTFRVADACPGECSGQPRSVAVADRLYFFLARGAEGSAAEDLWVTDGLPGGTFRLTSGLRFPGPFSPGWSAWIASRKVLYFAADDSVHGMELWRSDGTPGGTAMLADVRPGPAGSSPNRLLDFGGRLSFQADDGLGANPWLSDGTPQGTRLLRRLVAASDPAKAPRSFVVVGRTLFFTGQTPDRGVQLWRSDGSAQGTVPVTSLKPRAGSDAWPFTAFSVFDGRLVFVADTKDQGQELWISDGTAKGTRPLTSFANANAFRTPDLDLSLPERMPSPGYLFVANDGPHGYELWTTDGTPRGTRLFRDVCPGSCSGAVFSLVRSGARFYFRGDDGVHGLELWTSDGTPAGTRMAADLCPGSCRSDPFGFRAAGAKAFFANHGSDGSHQLWRTDGTAAGTVQLSRFSGPFGWVEGLEAVVLGGRLLFDGPDGTSPRRHELWLSNGTVAGTGLLADINTTDLSGSFPRRMFGAGGEAFFLASSGNGTEMWRSDGTEAGTVPVVRLGDVDEHHFELVPAAATRFFLDLLPGEGQSLWRLDGSAGSLRLTPADAEVLTVPVAVGGSVFFLARDSERAEDLWVSDGTVAGTRRVVEPGSGFDHAETKDLTAFGGLLYFTARISPERRELWRSDGTEAGTVRVTGDDLQLDLQGASLVAHAGLLWFMADDGEHGRELWSTDGTAAGTVLHELLPGPAGVTVAPVLWLGSRLFLTGGDSNDGFGTWIWDGSAAGALKISDVMIRGNAFFDRSIPTAAEGILYFSGLRNGQETLWKSDGTAAGTVEVTDAEGSPIRDSGFYTAFAGRLYFTTRQLLYQTDGTPEGTIPILELVAPGESAYHELVPAGPRLLFSKWDRATGTELWALEP